MIYEVIRREKFDRELFEASKARMGEQLLLERRAGLLQSLLEDLLETYRVELNQELINRYSS